MQIWQVALPSPLRKTFHYCAPENTKFPMVAGLRVRVNFANRDVIGLLLAEEQLSRQPDYDIKPILDVLDREPLLPAKLFELFHWAAHYYHHPIGDALFTTLPSLLRKGNPLPDIGVKAWQLTTYGKGLGPDSLKGAAKQKQCIALLQQQPQSEQQLVDAGISKTVLKALAEKNLISSYSLQHAPVLELLKQKPLTPTAGQKTVMDSVILQGYHGYLLDGETGSGKTEVYLQLIEKVLRYGKQALVLIPEIGLTPQTVARFRERFAVPVVTLHSGMTDLERLTAWEQARTGQAKVVLGTRSAIFTPLSEPGIIIVDEEHDSAYKQQDGFRYSARDLAVVRANRDGIPVILASGTPSLESLKNALDGKYQHLILDRVNQQSTTPWQLIDTRQYPTNGGLSEPLLQSISTTLAQEQQVLLFLNRRGYAPSLRCNHCGWVAECPKCDARFTVHKTNNKLICHHCERQRPIPWQCPNCKQGKTSPEGQGTERTEETLNAYFPQVPVLRVDRDSTRQKQALDGIYNIVNNGEPAILLGTQMLAKGHHFPNVTLVALLDVDGGLFSPDFRAPERMAQQITQVAGRAGRGEVQGKVLLQTSNPDHPLLQAIIQQPYRAFSQRLLPQREAHYLPPYWAMALLHAEDRHPENAATLLGKLRMSAKSEIAGRDSIHIIGPLPAPMERRAGFHRFQLSIMASNRAELKQILEQIIHHAESIKTGTTRWWLTVDPTEQ